MSDPKASRAARRSRRKVGVPVLLILVGGHLLLFNLGLTSWHPLLAAFTLWPLLLVAIGLDLVLARTNRWLAAAAAVLVLGGLTLATARLHDGRWSRPPTEDLRTPVEVPLQGADSARLVLEMRGGELRLSPVDEPPTTPAEHRGQDPSGTSATPTPAEPVVASSEPLVATGALFGGSKARVSVRCVRCGSALKARINGRGRRGGHLIVMPDMLAGSNDMLRLALSRSVPLDLGIDAEGAGLGLDLRGLNLRQLEVELDVGEARMLLPAPDRETSLLLDAGFATVDVVVPEGVPARLKVRSELSSVRIDQERFPRNGRVFESPTYETADARWLITIDAELSFVRVR